MIKELAEFGVRIRHEENNKKDSLIKDIINAIIEIDTDGRFENFYSTEKESFIEDVLRTEDKGRTSGIVPRLLVDNSQYVLGFPNDKARAKECLAKFIEKIEQLSNINEILPVIHFYQREDIGLNRAYEAFKLKFENKEINDSGNIAFIIKGSEKFLHEELSVYIALDEKYHKDEVERQGGDRTICTVCGGSNYRTRNIATHGVIKRVPDGQSSGCSLIAYNAEAFESYDLVGNDNSSVCTHCIKNYIIGLNWLMTNGRKVLNEKGKEVFLATNRRNFGPDTAMVYWTKEEDSLDELNMLDHPDAGEITNLISSVASGQEEKSRGIITNQFYSCTLSGAAARIAVRDWIQVSMADYKRNIAKWFQDIAIKAFGEIRYTPLYALARTAQRAKSENDPTISRIATHLWNAAIKNSKPPLWILSAVLKRIRFTENTTDGKAKETISPERAALIRFILNRNNKNGGYMINEQNDPNDTDPAIVCGKIFAVMERIQKAALGNEINAGIRERFFSFASTSPAPAFGRLMKLSQNHISKLKHEKPGLAVILDRQLQELCGQINGFPAIFSLEEQGQFALGYYHQKQHDYENAKGNKELQSSIENMEE